MADTPTTATAINPPAIATPPSEPVTTDKPSTTTTKEPTKEAVPSTNTTNTSNGGGGGIAATLKKFIPGLGAQPERPAAGSKRSKSSKRAKTGAATGPIGGPQDPALQTALTAEAPEKSELPDSLVEDSTGSEGVGTTKAKRGLANGSSGAGTGLAGQKMTDEELAVLQQKRFSPVLIIQKRLRAHNKKLQRIAAYEDETNLNADQKKALASKPALELVQKELNDIIKVFETEEAEDDKHIEKKKQYEEKQTQIRIAQAVQNANLTSQTDLTLLLQFLHLYSLFSPNTQSFAPPILPPVVANATAQQHAAVHALFDKLANGPLFGAAQSGPADDAVSHIKALQDGSSSDIIEGVSFADVKQMIIDLTAPPAEVGHQIPEDHDTAATVGSSALPTVDETGTNNDTSSTTPGFNFLQASELGQSTPGPVSAHDRALQSVSAAATPGFGSSTPILERPAVELGQGQAGWDSASPTVPTDNTTNWASEDTSTQQVRNWADEVEESTPSNPFTATPDVPSELAGREAANGETVDGAAAGVTGEGRGGRRGGRGGRGRGGPRGERGGRGGWTAAGSGERRGGDNFQWRRSDAINESAANAAIAAGEGAGEADGTGVAGERRGGFRGGRGRGEYRGRGRGEHRGGERGAHRGEYRGRGRGAARGAQATGAAAPATTEA